MRKSSSVQYLSSPEVIIHKNDFLIHVKKVSIRSQSIDCALERKHSSERPSTLPRRSSSAVGHKVTPSSAKAVHSNGDHKTSYKQCAPNVHYGLERKKANGLNGMKARMLYSGSHSTSCLPRNGHHVMKFTNKLNDVENLEDTSKQENAVTSILSFVGQCPTDQMRNCLNLGISEDVEY